VGLVEEAFERGAGDHGIVSTALFPDRIHSGPSPVYLVAIHFIRSLDLG
jgi:hypothetical protein